MAKRRWHGDYWTQKKLRMLELYCTAFLDDMADRPYRTTYVDGCAGTGRVERRKPGNTVRRGFFPLPPNISEGSARRSLRLERPFDNYVFIERDKARFAQLAQVREDFPELSDRIILRRWDVNNYLLKLCQKSNWDSSRAVIFLDPPGMQIQWETVEAIAATKAADLWYLFPLAMTVNRVLPKNEAKLKESHRVLLNGMFGTSTWHDEFYRTLTNQGFSRAKMTVKVAGCDAIGNFFVERLQTVFPFVVKRPLKLHNRTGIPLFMLCFASPSQRRAKLAQEILKRHALPAAVSE